MKKRIISIVLVIVLLFSVVPVTAISLDEKTLKTTLKGALVAGIGSFGKYGKAASGLLGPVLNKVLGIQDENGMILEKLEELEKKIDEINQKLDEIELQLNDIQKSITDLSAKLDSSTQAILNQIFEAKFGVSLDTFNTRMTSVAYITESMYHEINLLYEMDLEDEEYRSSELYKTLRVAELVESFNNTGADDYVNMVMTLSRYLEGGQVTMGSAKGLFESVYLATCNNAVLGGEAAMLIAPYLNQITETLSSAYEMLIIITECKLYVAEHYDEILDASTRGNENYDSDIASLVRYGIKTNYEDRLNTRLWRDLISSSSTSFCTLHDKYFGETDSVASEYNKMVQNHWFDYIKNCTFTNNDIRVTFYPLATSLEVYNSSLHINANTRDVLLTNDEVQSNINAVLSTEDVKRLGEHLIKNESGVFVDLTSGNTKSTTEATLFDILTYYGFDIPEPFYGVDNCYEQSSYKTSVGPQLLVYDSRVANYSDVQSADMYVSGFDCNAKNGYYLGTGDLYTQVKKYDDYQYYHYRNATADKSNSESFCFFYSFKQRDIDINSEADFESFILSVASGKDYYNALVTLNCDIDLSDISYASLWAGLTDSAYNKGFRGHFDGNSHTIYGLTDSGDSHGAGLFRSLGSGVTIAHLNLEDVSINNSKGTDSGALAARVYFSTGGDDSRIDVVNINSGNIDGQGNAGGLIGTIKSDISIYNVINNATVNSPENAGGICGCMQAMAYMNGCENKGKIGTASTKNAGGIFGLTNPSAYSIGQYRYCVNYGEISGVNAAGIGGGISSEMVNLTSCKNSGNIVNSSKAGGLLGYVGGAGADLNSCVNTGTVNAKEAAGGIVGWHAGTYKTAVSKCENKGKVICPKDRDQIVGKRVNNSNCYINNCLSNGSTSVASIFATPNIWMIVVIAIVIVGAIFVIIKKNKKSVM